MNQINGETGALRDATTAGHAAADGIAARMQKLQGYVDTAGAQWYGTAWPAFQAAHADWATGVAEVARLARQIGIDVGVAAGSYEDADEAGRGAMNQVAGMAGVGGALGGAAAGVPFGGALDVRA